MELRQYWHIIWRRIWIPVLLIGVVAGVSLLTAKTPPPMYTSSLRFTVGVTSQTAQAAPAGRVNEETFHAWVASEYLADDLSIVVGSQKFAADVNRHLAEMESSVQIFPGAISGITVAEKEHRILQLNLTSPGEIQTS